MGWLAATIGIIALVIFAIVYPGFRKFLLVLFGLSVASGVGLYLYSEHESSERQKRERLARSLIQESQVDFQNLALSNEYGSWKLKGLIKIPDTPSRRSN